MSTLAAFTGAKSEPATSQVTVSVLPMVHVDSVLCEVMTKGPEFPSTVTFILPLSDDPPPAKLSRTVYLKFITLPTEGTTSHLLSVFPAKTVEIIGMYLCDSALGFTERKRGPTVDVFTGGMGAVCGFVCSHVCVRPSVPSASVAEPSNINGVDLGIV